MMFPLRDRARGSGALRLRHPVEASRGAGPDNRRYGRPGRIHPPDEGSRHNFGAFPTGQADRAGAIVCACLRREDPGLAKNARRQHARRHRDPDTPWVHQVSRDTEHAGGKSRSPSHRRAVRKTPTQAGNKGSAVADGPRHRHDSHTWSYSMLAWAVIVGCRQSLSCSALSFWLALQRGS